MPNDERPISPTTSTVVGSVAGSGYRMDEPYHDEDQDATENTGLLGAGAEESHVDGLARERTESWIGWEDFTDIPPWRRPSVSAALRRS
jgi:hypothetical protein